MIGWIRNNHAAKQCLILSTNYLYGYEIEMRILALNCIEPGNSDYKYEETYQPLLLQDIFSGLNDGLLNRAEALAAVDVAKHQGSPQAGPSLPLKPDMMYHHGVGAPPPHNTRPHQVPFAPIIWLPA